MGHNISATDNVSLIASGNITNSFGQLVSAGGNFFAVSYNGSIGTSVASPFYMSASAVTAQALTGNVSLNNSTTGNVSVETSGIFTNSANGRWSMTAANSAATGINVVDDITSANVRVVSTNGGFNITGDINATNQVTLGAAVDITNAMVTGNVTGNNLVLSSGANIGSADRYQPLQHRYRYC